jgi:glycosyltransferase involved in cell wall biosynthesis
MLLVICSKSTWLPSIRREHAIASSAARHGHEVVFVERAADVRALAGAGSRRAWLRHLSSAPVEVQPRIQVLAQSTIVPGHRSAAAQWLDSKRLAAALARLPGIESGVVVATQPWQWSAVASAPAARRVFDGADDWRALIPGRAAAFDALHQRIAREADAVIVASGCLAPVFAPREATVVPNGASAGLLAAPVEPPPDALTLAYAGTLSERFDAALLGEALEQLPGWSAELYGQCQYAGRGVAPGPDLQAVLDRFPDRVRLHGPLERPQLAAALDRARILIAPHRARLVAGQDSMKLYDYATRGRPIVATPGALGDAEHIAGAGVIEAATAADFARAVTRAAAQPDAIIAGQRAWADGHAWELRWPGWARAAFG